MVAILILTPVVVTSFEPSPGHPLKWAPFVILGWVVAGGVYLIYRERRHERIDIDYAFRAAGEDPPEDEPSGEERPPRGPAPAGQP